MGKKLAAVVLCAALCLTALAGCGTAQEELQNVTLCEVTHSIFYAPQYVAMELGFFEEEGLSVELSNGGGADKVMSAVLSGSVDIGFAGPEASVYVYNEGKEDYTQVLDVYKRQGIRVECVQTDNGFEFTNRFSNSKRDFPTLFETTASQLGIRHKLIRPYTPRHNGKVERSHREDQKRFYSCHSFYSLDDFARQLAVHNRRSNNLPMRPLNYCTPSQFAVQFV